MSHSPIILLTNYHVAPSHRAEARALAIGRRLNREIVVVSACKQTRDKSALPIPALGIEQVKGRLNKFWRLLQANADASGITAKAARLNAHFLIISMPPGNLLTRLIHGFQAANIARRATCPVLVVKNQVNNRYRKVMIATDFSIASKAAALAALSFAPEAKFSAVHAYTLPDEMLMHELGLRSNVIKRYHSEAADRATQNLAHFVESLHSTAAVENYVVHGTAYSTILTYASWIDADLIVIGKRAGAGLWSLLTRCLMRQLLQKTQCDILIAPATDGKHLARHIAPVAREKRVAHL